MEQFTDVLKPTNMGTHEDERTALNKTNPLDGTKRITNPKTNPKTNQLILTLFS